MELKFLCKKCESKLGIDVRMQDRDVTCPNCQAAIRVPLLHAAPLTVGAVSPQPSASPLLSLAETEFLSGLSEPVTAAR